ncbi:MAG: hypothetical protein H9W81_21920 [Enterococcus sp.]|nr:hypothetical protein [Enterococcus sp.]
MVEVSANENELSEAVQAVAKVQDKINAVDEQSATARTMLKEAVDLHQKILSLRHDIDLSKSQIRELDGQITSIRSDVEGIDISKRGELEAQYRAVNTEFNQINNDLAVHQGELVNAQKNVARIESNVGNYEQRLAFEVNQVEELREYLSTSPAIEDLESQVNSYTNEISEAKGLVSSKTGLISDLKESIRLISHEHEGATCPTCHTELKEPQKLVEQFKENIETAQHDIEDAQKRNREATEKLNHVTSTIKEITSKRNTLDTRLETQASLQAALEAEKVLLVEARQALETFSTFDVDKARADVSRLDKRKREIISEGEKIGAAEKALARMEELIARKNTLESGMVPSLEQIDLLKDKRDEYGDLEFLEMEVNNYDATTAGLRNEYSNLYTQMKDMETRKASLSERAKAAKANLEREGKLASAKKTALATLEEKSAVSDLLDEYRKERIARIAPELSATATDLISQMTNGRFIEVIVKDDFATGVIKSDGMEYAVAELSGGEKSVVALALRIAIGSLITGENAGLLWLDEVLPAQDKERRDAILNVLRSLPIQQIVMINHTHEAEDVVDRVVKISYDGEGSTIEE